MKTTCESQNLEESKFAKFAVTGSEASEIGWLLVCNRLCLVRAFVGDPRKSSRALVPATVTKRSGLTPFRVFGAVQTKKIPTGLKTRDRRYLVMLSERQRVG
jgi:hypothetical protein